jgi:3-hydroxybutyryl-CoA dehydrogenase
VNVERLGVIGAGTMGAGIAQLGATAGFDVVLHDPDGDALRDGFRRVFEGIEAAHARGRLDDEQRETALGRVKTSEELQGLRGCGLLIEAAPEDLDLKRRLFARLEAICGGGTILATNTSSLSVTAIATGAEHPGRVVGIHFFNPPERMMLVEIVAGEESSEQALASSTEVAEAMGRTPIRARDSVGFVANRCARPYTLEALRMLAEGVAGHEQIDRICRIGGGFRMGPFELMDLIGVDVNLAVARSFFDRSFGEPRWLPSEIQAQMVEGGRLGRKTGRGFYDYSGGGEYRDPDPEVEAERPVLDPVELEALAGPPAPLVLDRVAAQIANEAAYTLAEQVASADDIDTAMRLGFNWPAGPLEFAELLGAARAVDILDQLRDSGGNAYGVAPLLRDAAARQISLRNASG